MASKEGMRSSDISERADSSQRARRNRISSWLMTRGLNVAALGSLVAAGWLLIKGGTITVVKGGALGVGLIASPVVAAAGAVAAVGVAMAAAGVGKRMIDSMRRG